MGLFGKFESFVVCPCCRQKGAKKSLGAIKCRNVSCAKYDSQYAQSVLPSGAPSRGVQSFSGNFNPGLNSLTLEYRNYLGDDKSFDIDKTTLIGKAAYVSARIAPTGKRVSFNKKFIKNLSEVEDAINAAIVEELNSPAIEYKISIKYKNFAGKNMELFGNTESLRSEGEKISVRVGPRGKKFLLKKANIANLSEIEKFIKL